LQPNTTYLFELSACNMSGCTTPDMLSWATSPPPPQQVEAQFDSEFGSIDLSWDEVAGATSYTVYRSDTPSDPDSYKEITQTNALSYSDTNVKPNTSYGYRVAACSQFGCSDIAQFLPVLPGPTPYPADVGVSSSEEDFGDQRVGTASLAREVMVSNTGGFPARSVSLVLGGDDAGDFQLSESTCQDTLVPGAACTFEVSFAPGSPGTKFATASVTSDALNSPATVSLSGRGVQPELSLAPAEHDFGSPTLGSPTASTDFTVTNTGTADLDVTDVALGGDNASSFEITADPCTAPAIVPGGTCTVAVRFLADAPGEATAQLVVTSDAPGSPHSADLAGQAVYQFGGPDGDGFLPPLDDTTVNVVKAGRAIPVRFSLGGDFGLEIFARGYPQSVATDCSDISDETTVEGTDTADDSSLTYDESSQTYKYVWKTRKDWSGCRQLLLGLNDGSVQVVDFRFE
jgi:hypothetical protein